MHIIFRIILYTAWISLTSYGMYYQYSKNIEFEKDGVYTKAKIIDFSRTEMMMEMFHIIRY